MGILFQVFGEKVGRIHPDDQCEAGEATLATMIHNNMLHAGNPSKSKVFCLFKATTTAFSLRKSSNLPTCSWNHPTKETTCHLPNLKHGGGLKLGTGTGTAMNFLQIPVTRR